MHKSILLLASLLLTLVAAPPVMAAEDVVRIGGSGTGCGVIKHIAREYGKSNPGVKISIAPSLGSSGGIKALLSGSLDFALSARPLKDEEKSSGAVAVFSGRTPFVFMVNKGVPVSTITTRELEAYYGLQQLTWPDGSQVRLILRPEGDSDTKLIQSISPSLDKSLKSALSSQGMFVAMTDQDSDKAIERTPGALGATTLAQHMSEKLTGKVLSFNGSKASLKTIRDGSYPLTKSQTVLVIPAKLTPAAKKFVSYLSSPQARAIWQKYGILPDAKQ